MDQSVESILQDYFKQCVPDLAMVLKKNHVSIDSDTQKKIAAMKEYIIELETKLGVKHREFNVTSDHSKSRGSVLNFLKGSSGPKPVNHTLSRKQSHEMAKRTMKVSSMLNMQGLSSDIKRFEGYLEKKKKEKVLGRTPYQKRYFVLDTKTGSLNYFKTQNDKLRRPLGSIKLEDVLRLMIDEDGHSFELAINKRTFPLRAPTKDDCKQWVDAIFKCCPKVTKMDDTLKKERASILVPPKNAPPAVRSHPKRRMSSFSTVLGKSGNATTMEGLLKKLSPKAVFGINQWQNRYFVLDFKSGLLSYFKNKAESKVGSEKGIIRCHDISNITTKNKQFSIIMKDGKTYVLEVAILAEADAWIKAILKCRDQPTQQQVEEKKALEDREINAALVSTSREIMSDVMQYCTNQELGIMSGVCKDWYRYACRIYDTTRASPSEVTSEQLNTSLQTDAPTSAYDVIFSSSDEEVSSGYDDDSEDEDMMPVVIDHGAYTIKAGLTAHPETGDAEYLPSVEIISPTLLKNGVVWNLPLSEDINDWKIIEDAWINVFKKLHLQPKGHPVIMTIAPDAPEYQKHIIETILFNHLNVPAVYITPSPVLVAYSYGVFTGLIVDMGYTAVRIVPIVKGFMIDKGIITSRHLGGKNLDDFMIKLLKKYHPDTFGLMKSSEITPLAMRFRKDVVLIPENFEEAYDDPRFSQKVEFEFNGNVVQAKLHKELIECAQAYFDPRSILGESDDSVLSLHEMITKSISECAVDVRMDLFSNILMSGASSYSEGLGTRITEELRIESPHSASFIKVTEDPNRKHAVWSGGSILTTIEAFHENWKPQWEFEQENGTAKVTMDEDE